MASVQALPPHQGHIVQVPQNQRPLAGLPSPHTITTTPPSKIHRGPVSAPLNFYDPPSDNATPFNYVEDPPAGQPARNFGTATHTVTLSDIRGVESTFSLARNAFAALKGHPHNPAIDWDDDASVKALYYPEVEQLVLDHVPDARRVVIFDHTIRRPDPRAPRGPVTRVHIDQTPKSAASRVARHAASPEAAAQQLKTRYRIINVWRPLNGAVESIPLGFADASSVAPGDVVGVEHRYPTWTGETAGVKFDGGMRWHYWSGVQNDERILLQCSDSMDEGVRAPHTAFEDPRTGPDAKGRESVEVRCLVFD